MPFLNTYVALTAPLYIQDAIIIEKGRRRPINFLAAGDSIDITKVDIGMFILSSLSGQLHKSFVAGLITAQPVEVSDELYKLAHDALARNGHSSPPGHMIPTTHKVVEIEPGLSLAIENTAPALMKPEPAITLLPEFGKSDQIEAGMGIASPVGDDLKPVTTEVPPVEQVEEALGAGDAVKSWQAGMGFKEQKAFVMNSTDAEFLKAVSAKDSKDTKNFQRMAAVRLKELSGGDEK